MEKQQFSIWYFLMVLVTRLGNELFNTWARNVCTREMGTVGSLVLGAVATKVIHLARIPVTPVK